MANVNVGKRTPKQDAEAQKELEQAYTEQGDRIVEENGGKWAVKTMFGMTVKTRIA